MVDMSLHDLVAYTEFFMMHRVEKTRRSRWRRVTFLSFRAGIVGQRRSHPFIHWWMTPHTARSTLSDPWPLTIVPTVFNMKFTLLLFLQVSCLSLCNCPYKTYYCLHFDPFSHRGQCKMSHLKKFTWKETLQVFICLRPRRIPYPMTDCIFLINIYRKVPLQIIFLDDDSLFFVSVVN